MKPHMFLAIVVCTAGCAYQVIDISKRYFSYPTKRYMKVQVVIKLSPPGVSVCWSLKENVGSINNETTEDWKKLYKFLDTANVQTIISLMPSNVTVLNPDPGCVIRFTDQMSWRYPWYNREECHKLINVEKYLYRLTLCYKFTPNAMIGQLNTKHASLSPFIYMLLLDMETFLNMHAVTAYGHNSKSSPLFDSVFSIENAIKSHNETYRIGIIVTPLSMDRLKAPYDTNCRNGVRFKTGSEYRLRELNIATMRELQHVHTLEHVSNPYPYPILHSGSFRNETLNDKFMELNGNLSKASFTACHFEYNIPRVRIEQDERIAIVVNWPQDPSFNVQSMPDQDIIDFIIYICSTVGMWLGLSVFSCFDLFMNSVSKLHAKNENENIQNSKRIEKEYGNRKMIHRLHATIAILRRQMAILSRQQRRVEILSHFQNTRWMYPPISDSM